MLRREFYYDLPENLIAQYPLKMRGQSKLMIYNSSTDTVHHTVFQSLTDYLIPGDILILNDTKVLSARLYGRKITGGRVEILCTRKMQSCSKKEELWEAMLKPSKGIYSGTVICLDGGAEAEIVEERRGGFKLLRLRSDKGVQNIFEERGEIPLPPYIRRKAEESDYTSYQTVFAKRAGAIAAPTAGLHFTKEIFEKIIKNNIEIHFITLHVGPGTFMPVREESIANHKMLPEYYEIGKPVFDAVIRAREEKRRVLAVGTTVTKALESSVENGWAFPTLAGYTDLFIYPGYSFKMINGLITNFHLPCSTLIMLISAFAGKEKIKNLYEEAIKSEYRFYSYGDAMMLL